MVSFLFQPAAELLDRVPKRLVIADFDLSFLFAYLLHLVNILRERAAKDSFITQDRNEHLEGRQDEMSLFQDVIVAFKEWP